MVAKRDLLLELLVHADFSGLDLLVKVVQNLAAGEFSVHFALLLSAANLISLDKGEEKIRPIAIGIVLRHLVTKFLMPTEIAEAKDYLEPLQVGCDGKSGLDASVQDARETMSVYGGDCNILASYLNAHNAFNRTSRQQMLFEAAKHAPSLVRFMNALYGRSQSPPYVRLGERIPRSRTAHCAPSEGVKCLLRLPPTGHPQTPHSSNLARKLSL